MDHDPLATAATGIARHGAVTLVGGAMPAPFLTQPSGPGLTAMPLLGDLDAAVAWAATHPDLFDLDGGLWALGWTPPQAILLVDMAGRSRHDVYVHGPRASLATRPDRLGPALEAAGLTVDWAATPTDPIGTWLLDIDTDGTVTAQPAELPAVQTQPDQH